MAGKEFKLPNEIVEVRYIIEQRGIVTDPNHVLYGGLAPTARKGYVPKKLRNGMYANILNNEEKEYLENMLSLPENGLSIYNKGEKDYWKNFKFYLGKDTTYLNLNDPIDYIKYKVLLSYDEEIAPNVASLDKAIKKATYRFVIVRKEEETRTLSKTLNIRKKAYEWLSKIDNDRSAMLDYLRVAEIPVAEDTDTETLVLKVGEVVEKNPTKFISVIEDPHYETRVLIQKSIANGQISKKGKLYYGVDGTGLANPNTSPVLENVITYLEDSMNQEYRLLLMSKQQKSKK